MVKLFNLLVLDLGLAQPVHLMLETLDVLDARLENGALVGPRVAHHLEERVRILGQQAAQLFDPVINIETATAFN